ncbi:NAD-dependent epimerase/dehydratase family protein [Chitinophagaceae bacterium LWZ2-11]
MKILVIGSKGFIGSHFWEYCQKQLLHETWACDVAIDYGAKNYYQIDAANADFNELFEEHDFDICINCSGAASVPDSIVHPLRDYYLNTVNVFKLLEAIRKYRPRCKFLNLSSAAVYGNPQKLPVNETDPIQPLSPYGYHKSQAENICKEFADQFNLSVASARIFSAYGPGLKKQLLWDIWQKIKANDIITLFGTGNETRDFIYITDLIDALWCIVQQAKFKGEVYNVANGNGDSIASIAHCYQAHCGKKIEINFSGEERKGDPTKWQADITLLQQLGYQQKVKLEEGIINYIQWIKGLE